MSVPLFVTRPTLRPPRGKPRARVLVILSPLGADVPSVKRLGRRLREAGVEAIAAIETHGEARGEHAEPLHPNLLLVEAAGRDFDALVVAGGAGARRVVEDPLARQVIARHAAAGHPVAALGAGRAVLERAGVSGRVSDDADALADWLCGELGVAVGRGGRRGFRARRATPVGE